MLNWARGAGNLACSRLLAREPRRGALQRSLKLRSRPTKNQEVASSFWRGGSFRRGRFASPWPAGKPAATIGCPICLSCIVLPKTLKLKHPIGPVLLSFRARQFWGPVPDVSFQTAHGVGADRAE